MYKLLRSLLFLQNAEQAHHFTTSSLKRVLKIPILGTLFRSAFVLEDKKLEREVFGLKFKNPIGLAAGFDKNAEFFEEMGELGFGFIEIGTVTPLPQSGNEKPRLFRLKKDEAILNRMGFNNLGVDEAIKNLSKPRKNKNILIGGNIGKNKITPNESAVNDYIICFEKLKPFVDYFVVNVSSPNTPNLRDLQEKEPLKKILFALQERNEIDKKPILLKIAPDLSNEQLLDIIEIVTETKINGVIATNTTISRENLITEKASVEALGAGGISGKPLLEKSNYVISFLHKHSKGQFPIIGVGGIHSADDAIKKLEAGASLVQLYTGFIYEGPSLIKDIKRKLIQKN